jgi:hypothetical protein
MKPTQKCKRNYVLKNYAINDKIPSLGNVKREFNIDKFGILWASVIKDLPCGMINYMLKNIPEWSCDNCVNKYICKLNAINDETYKPM